MEQQATTKQDINKLIEFRQVIYDSIYENGLLSRRDALFNLLDGAPWPRPRSRVLDDRQ